MSISQDIIFRLENSKLYTQRGFPQDVNRGGRFLADLQATKQTNGYKETSKLPQRQFADHPPTQDTRAVNVILQNASTLMTESTCNWDACSQSCSLTLTGCFWARIFAKSNCPQVYLLSRQVSQLLVDYRQRE